MPSTIPEVANATIKHALFMDLQLGDTTYYLSDAVSPVTFGNVDYFECGELLQVSSLRNDFKSTQGTITISLSGIPNKRDYMNIVLNEKIKGGEVILYRVFYNNNFEPQTAYLRYKGIISNFNIEENTDVINGVITNTIVLSCSSIVTLLNKKISGQRTNGADRRRFYPGDISFDRVQYITTLPEFG